MHTQPSSSKDLQPVANTAPSWWRNGCPELFPPGTSAEPVAEELEEPRRIEAMPWASALSVLRKFPGRVFLQPDLEQVWTAAL